MDFSTISHRSIVGKLLRLPLSLIPNGLVLPILQGPLRGKRWIAGSSTHGCWLGSYEYSKQQLFTKHVKTGDIIFDIGANVGFYSLLAAVLTGPSGKVISFEPLPRNLELLRRHINLNKLSNCSVYDAAVTAAEGTATFHIAKDPSMGGLSNERLSTQGIDVRTVAIDRMIESGQIPRPHLIKCDVEGGEYEVMLGALHTLKGNRPVIFLATHGPEVHARCCDLLRDLDYELTSLSDLPIEKTDELLAISRSH